MATETVSPSRATPARPTWLRSPQRVWLRRAVFQIHLWVGLAITVYAVLIGLSGSALVFREEIQDALDGHAWQAPHTLPAAGFERSVRAIEAARPGWRATGLESLNRPGRPPLLLLQAAPSDENERLISFDPATGRVLTDRLRFSGPMGFATNLHFYLLAGNAGLRASGFMALGLLILCLTGLVLWWPGVRRWRSALTLRWRVRWQRLNWDLHSVIGFWSCAALVVVTFTGLYFAFPQTVEQLVLFASGSGAGKSAPPAPKPHPTAGGKHLTLDEALAAARRALPADAPPGYFAIPAKPDQPYFATGYYTGSLPYSQLVQVTLDPYSGARLSLTDTRRQSLGHQVIQYFFTVHFGSFGGPGVLGFAIKIVWLLLGLIPALLAATGFLMYWNRKLSRLWHH